MMQRLLGSDVTSIDRWYLCGPGDLVTTMHDDLASEEVPTERIHLELFGGTKQSTHVDDYPKSDVTITLSGANHSVELAAGETVLESALKKRHRRAVCLSWRRVWHMQSQDHNGSSIDGAKLCTQHSRARGRLHTDVPIPSHHATVAVDYDSWGLSQRSIIAICASLW